MSTVTLVVNKDKKVQYKDYVNFLDNYKNSKKEDNENNSVGYITSGSNSSSSINVDVEMPTKSFNEYLENYTKKKFQPVHPNLNGKQMSVKTEVFIQINNDKCEDNHQEHNKKFPTLIVNVKPTQDSETKHIIKNFENLNKNATQNTPLKSPPLNTNNRYINESPVLLRSVKVPAHTKVFPPPSTPKGNISPATNGHYSSQNGTASPVKKTEFFNQHFKPNSTPTAPKSTIPQPPPPPQFTKTTVPNTSVVYSPPSPQFNQTTVSIPSPPPFPQTKTPVSNVSNKTPPKYPVSTRESSGIDRISPGGQQKDIVDGSTLNKNDPRVKKAVYGALRNMYGAYHDKANDYLSTLPKNRVKKGNGLDSIINSIAAKGGLEKLSGRAKVEAD